MLVGMTPPSPSPSPSGQRDVGINGLCVPTGAREAAAAMPGLESAPNPWVGVIVCRGGLGRGH